MKKCWQAGIGSKYSHSVTFNTTVARLGHWMSRRFNCGRKEK